MAFRFNEPWTQPGIKTPGVDLPGPNQKTSKPRVHVPDKFPGAQRRANLDFPDKAFLNKGQVRGIPMPKASLPCRECKTEGPKCSHHRCSKHCPLCPKLPRADEKLRSSSSAFRKPLYGPYDYQPHQLCIEHRGMLVAMRGYIACLREAARLEEAARRKEAARRRLPGNLPRGTSNSLGSTRKKTSWKQPVPHQPFPDGQHLSVTVSSPYGTGSCPSRDSTLFTSGSIAGGPKGSSSLRVGNIGRRH